MDTGQRGDEPVLTTGRQFGGGSIGGRVEVVEADVAGCVRGAAGHDHPASRRGQGLAQQVGQQERGQMVDLEGHSLEEISETTGWGISKIKMRLFRIRPQLRQMIAKFEEQK